MSGMLRGASVREEAAQVERSSLGELARVADLLQDLDILFRPTRDYRSDPMDDGEVDTVALNAVTKFLSNSPQEGIEPAQSSMPASHHDEPEDAGPPRVGRSTVDGPPPNERSSRERHVESTLSLDDAGKVNANQNPGQEERVRGFRNRIGIAVESLITAASSLSNSTSKEDAGERKNPSREKPGEPRVSSRARASATRSRTKRPSAASSRRANLLQKETKWESVSDFASCLVAGCPPPAHANSEFDSLPSPPASVISRMPPVHDVLNIKPEYLLEAKDGGPTLFAFTASYEDLFDSSCALEKFQCGPFGDADELLQSFSSNEMKELQSLTLDRVREAAKDSHLFEIQDCDRRAGAIVDVLFALIGRPVATLILDVVTARYPFVFSQDQLRPVGVSKTNKTRFVARSNDDFVSSIFLLLGASTAFFLSAEFESTGEPEYPSASGDSESDQLKAFRGQCVKSGHDATVQVTTKMLELSQRLAVQLRALFIQIHSCDLTVISCGAGSDADGDSSDSEEQTETSLFPYSFKCLEGLRALVIMLSEFLQVCNELNAQVFRKMRDSSKQPAKRGSANVQKTPALLLKTGEAGEIQLGEIYVPFMHNIIESIFGALAMVEARVEPCNTASWRRMLQRISDVPLDECTLWVCGAQMFLKEGMTDEKSQGFKEEAVQSASRSAAEHTDAKERVFSTAPRVPLSDSISHLESLGVVKTAAEYETDAGSQSSACVFHFPLLLTHALLSTEENSTDGRPGGQLTEIIDAFDICCEEMASALGASGIWRSAPGGPSGESAEGGSIQLRVQLRKNGVFATSLSSSPQLAKKSERDRQWLHVLESDWSFAESAFEGPICVQGERPGETSRTRASALLCTTKSFRNCCSCVSRAFEVYEREYYFAARRCFLSEAQAETRASMTAAAGNIRENFEVRLQLTVPKCVASTAGPDSSNVHWMPPTLPNPVDASTELFRLSKRGRSAGVGLPGHPSLLQESLVNNCPSSKAENAPRQVNVRISGAFRTDTFSSGESLPPCEQQEGTLMAGKKTPSAILYGHPMLGPRRAGLQRLSTQGDVVASCRSNLLVDVATMPRSYDLQKTLQGIGRLQRGGFLPASQVGSSAPFAGVGPNPISGVDANMTPKQFGEFVRGRRAESVIQFLHALSNLAMGPSPGLESLGVVSEPVEGAPCPRSSLETFLSEGLVDTQRLTLDVGEIAIVRADMVHLPVQCSQCSKKKIQKTPSRHPSTTPDTNVTTCVAVEDLFYLNPVVVGSFPSEAAE